LSSQMYTANRILTTMGWSQILTAMGTFTLNENHFIMAKRGSPSAWWECGTSVREDFGAFQVDILLLGKYFGFFSGHWVHPFHS